MNVYLRAKNDSKSFIKLLLLLMIPFALYGFYKNGILLYKKDLINLFSLFKVPFLVCISIIITYILKKLFEEDFISYRLLLNIFISIITPAKTNIIVFIVLLVLLNILYKFKKLNIPLIYMILYIITSYLFKNLSYQNIYEESVVHNYTLTNYLFGCGSGGISNTLTIYSILSFIYLITKFEYKKHIPITAFVVYYVLITISFLLGNNADINFTLNNNLIFAFVYLNTISIFTPYTKGGNYIYGFALGLFTFLFSFFDINIGVYITSLILSLCYPFFDKIILKIK